MSNYKRSLLQLVKTIVLGSLVYKIKKTGNRQHQKLELVWVAVVMRKSNILNMKMMLYTGVNDEQL